MYYHSEGVTAVSVSMAIWDITDQQFILSLGDGGADLLIW